MPIYVFILLHLFYLLFLIFLINAYVKDIGEKKNDEILKLNSYNIFIPENTTYNELYIQKLHNLYLKKLKNNIKFNIKYINILPYADTLISKNGLWNLLTKYNSGKYLYKYFPKTFILQNLYNRIEFSKLFYNYFNDKNINKNKIKKVLILKKNINNKKGLKLFFIENKNDIVDIYNIYYLENYKVIQEFISNPYLYLNKIVILRVYLVIKKIPKKEYIFRREEWIKCLYCSENYNMNLKNEKIYISDSKFYDKNYPKNLGELFINLKLRNEILIKIDNIFEIIKNSSKDLIFNNKILEESIQFQLFGCDFILDNSYNPYLLEINKDPCLNNNFNKEEEIIKKNIIKNMYDFIRE